MSGGGSGGYESSELSVTYSFLRWNLRQSSLSPTCEAKRLPNGFRMSNCMFHFSAAPLWRFHFTLKPYGPLPCLSISCQRPFIKALVLVASNGGLKIAWCLQDRQGSTGSTSASVMTAGTAANSTAREQLLTLGRASMLPVSTG